MPLSEKDHIENVGKGENERASFGVGSTTQGGSNFGQGSSNLGVGAAKQGSEGNKGANYDNEKDKLGDSSVGTNNEGSASPDKGAGDSTPEPVKESSKKGMPGWSGEEDRSDKRRKQDITPDDAGTPREGDRKDTNGTQVFHRSTQNNYRPSGGRGWSTSEENY